VFFSPSKVARFDKVAVKEVEMVSEEVGKGKGVRHILLIRSAQN